MNFTYVNCFLSLLKHNIPIHGDNLHIVEFTSRQGSWPVIAGCESFVIYYSGNPSSNPRNYGVFEYSISSGCTNEVRDVK